MYYQNEPRLYRDQNANDSDKTFTVPDNRVWELVTIYIENTTPDTDSNRQIQVDIMSGSEVLYPMLPAAVQAKNTTEYYWFQQGLGEPAETVAGRHFVAIPPGLRLRPGWTVRVWDSNAQAVTTDDMLVTLIVNEESNV